MVVICISSIQFMCGWVNKTEERRGSAAGTGYLGTNCPKVQVYKNARTARRYADAWNYIIIIVLIYCTFIARLSRRGSYAFFSWWRSWELWESKMDTATPSYGPPWGYWISKEKRRLWKLSRRFMGHRNVSAVRRLFFFCRRAADFYWYFSKSAVASACDIVPASTSVSVYSLRALNSSSSVSNGPILL